MSSNARVKDNPSWVWIYMQPPVLRSIDKAQIVRTTKPPLYHYFTFASHRWTLLTSNGSPHMSLDRKAVPQGATKAIRQPTVRLVNILFENFLPLSISFVLRESELSKRVGQMDRWSQ